MNPVLPLADTAPVSDLLDVFAAYGGDVLFRGLLVDGGGGAGLFGHIGWLFTAMGMYFTLWGFVLRTRGAGGEGRTGEVALTWIVVGFMMGGPVLVTGCMEAADSVYSGSVGGPQKLTAACVKAAYALPEINGLFDASNGSGGVGVPGLALTIPGPAPAAASGSIFGYVKAYWSVLWGTAANYVQSARTTWNGMMQALSMLSCLGAAMLKGVIVLVTLGMLYLMLLASAALIWFMDQFRYFLAVTGTMMLPLFVGLFSLPSGHPGRSVGQAYVMNLLSVTLWPVAWAVGHTGTVVLYDALISLIAGTGRVPAVATTLQWSAITGGGSPDQSQVAAVEAALGNWFMGNVTAVLSILVGGVGFAVWIACVTVFAPVFLHKLLTTGALFMGEAMSVTGRRTADAVGVISGSKPIQGLIAGRAAGAAGKALDGLEKLRPQTVQPAGFGNEGTAGIGAGEADEATTIADAASKFDGRE